MSKTIVAVLASGLMISAPALAQETFTGTWDIIVDRQDSEDGKLVWTVTEVDGEYAVEAEFKAEDEAGASLMAMLGTPTSVEIDFDGKSFTMTTTYGDVMLVIVNSGVIDGDNFEGASTMKFGGAGDVEGPMTGTRR
jgi:hypothetical protein